jgi:hypothetical protein
LTFNPASLDTVFNAELEESRNCGHGHVYAHGLRTRPRGS